MNWLSYVLKQRLVLWAMGQFLPKSIDFKPYLREALLGITAAAFGGALLAIAVGTMLAALHFFMVAKGLTVFSSLGIVGVIALLLAFSAFYMAKRCMSISTNFKTSKPKDMVRDASKAVIGGFLDGWNSVERSYKRPKAKRQVLTLEQPQSRRTHY